MTRRPKPIARDGDPCPYDGPIQTVHGTRPFNRYLWPTEQWVAYDTIKHAPYDFRIDLVELADGRWSTGGHVHEIERDRVLTGERCCFPTRSEAVRAQAARIIRRARRAGRADVVAWALGIVAQALDRPVRSRAAAVYRAEAEARRQSQPAFAAVLGQWAENAERHDLPEQPDLFGAAA